MTTKLKIILGIDPGYDRVGWAVGEKSQGQIKLLEFGCIETDKKSSLFERYRQIDQELTQIIKKHQPKILQIESLFFFKNQKTALKVSEARGVILSCALRQKLEIREFTPLQVKQAATGFGRADKTAVAKMVALLFKIEVKKLKDDTVDALALLLMGGV